jgi:transcriptional regulator with XRE-family HTH domain
MKLNEEIKTMRSDLGLSQKALGVRIGKPEKAARDHINDIELGRKRLAAEDYILIKRLWEVAQETKQGGPSQA